MLWSPELAYRVTGGTRWRLVPSRSRSAAQLDDRALRARTAGRNRDHGADAAPATRRVRLARPGQGERPARGRRQPHVDAGLPAGGDDERALAEAAAAGHARHRAGVLAVRRAA